MPLSYGLTVRSEPVEGLGHVAQPEAVKPILHEENLYGSAE
jgi:hypothetical protein